MNRFLTVASLSLALSFTAAVLAETGGGISAADFQKKSTPDMVEHAGKLVDGMEAMLKKSFKLLEQAINSADVSATNTRNEAITAMKGLVKLSEGNYVTLQQRAAEKDRKGVEHEYVKITIAAAKVRELFAQVQSAGGVDIDLELTDVERTLTIGADLSPDDLLTELFVFVTPDVIPEPPINASPYF